MEEDDLRSISLLEDDSTTHSCSPATKTLNRLEESQSQATLCLSQLELDAAKSLVNVCNPNNITNSTERRNLVDACTSIMESTQSSVLENVRSQNGSHNAESSEPRRLPIRPATFPAQTVKPNDKRNHRYTTCNNNNNNKKLPSKKKPAPKKKRTTAKASRPSKPPPPDAQLLAAVQKRPGRKRKDPRDIQVFSNGQSIGVFETLAAAAKAMRANTSTIVSQCLNGKLSHYKQYTCAYAEKTTSPNKQDNDTLVKDLNRDAELTRKSRRIQTKPARDEETRDNCSSRRKRSTTESPQTNDSSMALKKRFRRNGRIAIQQLDQHGRVVGTYPTLVAAAKNCNVSHQRISEVLSGKMKQYGGFTFRRAECSAQSQEEEKEEKERLGSQPSSAAKSSHSRKRSAPLKRPPSHIALAPVSGAVAARTSPPRAKTFVPEPVETTQTQSSPPTKAIVSKPVATTKRPTASLPPTKTTRKLDSEDSHHDDDDDETIDPTVVAKKDAVPAPPKSNRTAQRDSDTDDETIDPKAANPPVATKTLTQERMPKKTTTHLYDSDLDDDETIDPTIQLVPATKPFSGGGGQGNKSVLPATLHELTASDCNKRTSAQGGLSRSKMAKKPAPTRQKEVEIFPVTIKASGRLGLDIKDDMVPDSVLAAVLDYRPELTIAMKGEGTRKNLIVKKVKNIAGPAALAGIQANDWLFGVSGNQLFVDYESVRDLAKANTRPIHFLVARKSHSPGVNHRDQADTKARSGNDSGRALPPPKENQDGPSESTRATPKNNDDKSESRSSSTTGKAATSSNSEKDKEGSCSGEQSAKQKTHSNKTVTLTTVSCNKAPGPATKTKIQSDSIAPSSSKPAPNDKRKPRAKKSVVPFCGLCNGRNTKRPVHHAWCPKNPQHDSSGADEVLERIQHGLKVACPGCTQEWNTGRRVDQAMHSKQCKDCNRIVASPAKSVAVDSLLRLRGSGEESQEDDCFAADDDDDISVYENPVAKKQPLRKFEVITATQRAEQPASNAKPSNKTSTKAIVPKKKAQSSSKGKTKTTAKKVAKKTKSGSGQPAKKAANTGSKQGQKSTKTKTTSGRKKGAEKDASTVRAASASSDNEKLEVVWVDCDNVWGPDNLSDEDFVVYSGEFGVRQSEAIVPSERFDLDPFASKRYASTHADPRDGLHTIVLARDTFSQRSWGFSCKRHEFGGACLVSDVEPLSPATSSVLVGSGNQCASPLHVNDMLLVVNGKNVGGMTKTTLEMELDKCGRELIMSVSRYRFADKEHTEAQGAEQRSLRAIDEAINDDRALEWVDVVGLETNLSSDKCHQELQDDSVVPYDDDASSLTSEGDYRAGRKLNQTSTRPDQSLSFAHQKEKASRPRKTTLQTFVPMATNRTIENVTPELRKKEPTEKKVELESQESIDPNTDVPFGPTVSPQTLEKKGTSSDSVEQSNCLDTGSNDLIVDKEIRTPKQQGDCQKSAASTPTKYGNRKGDDSSNGETDDGNAWAGCVCGVVHNRRVAVFWIKCDFCGTWYNASSICLGFDESAAKKIPHWSCWGCPESEGSIASKDKNQSDSSSLTNEPDQVFAVGDYVFVKEHAWPGVNNSEGVANVLSAYLDEDGDQVYDIKYIVGGKTKGVLPKFLTPHCF